MTDRLAGKVAFITGAGTGIGRSASELFASEGARVVVAEIDTASGAETEERIRSAGGEALWVETDVTDAESVRAAFDRAVDRFGRLDVVYNNAGGSTTIDGPVTEAPEEEFWRVIRLDLFGTFLGCKYGIPRLIESGGGSVINTSSNVALMAVRRAGLLHRGEGRGSEHDPVDGGGVCEARCPGECDRARGDPHGTRRRIGAGERTRGSARAGGPALRMVRAAGRREHGALSRFRRIEGHHGADSLRGQRRDGLTRIRAEAGRTRSISIRTAVHRAPVVTS